METVQGIVIRSQDFQDYDHIVTIYSAEFGKFGFVSLGTRKQNSKNKPSVQLFAQSKFEVFKSNQGKLSKLKKGELVLDNQSLAHNYFNYVLGSVSLDLTNKIFPDNVACQPYFENLSYLIQLLNKDFFPFKNFSFFFYQSLSYINQSFNLDSCYLCGSKDSQFRYFNFKKYSVICRKCYLENYRNLENDVLDSDKYVNLLNELNQQKFMNLTTKPVEINLVRVLVKHVLTFYQQRLNLWSPSFEVLKNSLVLEN